MSEYCEYMWDPTRGHVNTALARSIYVEEAKFDVRDRKLAIKTVRAILRDMPGVDLKHCTDEYITRFLLARKYRTEQAAALIAAYQAQIAHRQDIFGNLTARDPPLQRALRAGIPGVLPARDRKGRCVLVILASQWDPIAVPALSVQRAIFLVLETLIQDPRNQQCGFVAVVDWSGFSLRQGGALGAAALRNLIAALRGRFPARFKAVHFLSAPLYVQATLALVKPFLDEKTRHKIYLHGNNLSTLHEHLPTDILPAELGGTGPAFNPGLWAEPVIHSAMKEAELAAIKRDKELAEKAMNAYNASEESTIKGQQQQQQQQQQQHEISPPENDASRQRTPGNGEEANHEDRMINHQNTTSSERRRRIEDNESKKISDSGSLDANDSLETCSNNGDSPLIQATSNKASGGTEATTDLLDGIGSSKNSYTLPHEQNRTFSGKTNKNKMVKRRDDGNKNFERATNDENREADNRTRFRVYRDEEDNETLVEANGAKVGQIRGNSESEDIVCLDPPSETNSNEFEMISNNPDSDEGADNSLETLKVEKIIIKNSRNGSLPEEANLIT